jgi:parallel beta-helix repeat protein
VTVGDNVIANVAGTGISSSNLNNVNVDGNVVWGAGANGITAGNSDNSNILNNQVRDPGNNGIFINDSTDIQIRSNFVQGANNTGGSTYYAVRVSTGCASIIVSSNKTRATNPNSTPAQYAFSSAGPGGTNYRFGNDWGPVGTGAGLFPNAVVTTGFTSSALDVP